MHVESLKARRFVYSHSLNCSVFNVRDGCRLLVLEMDAMLRLEGSWRVTYETRSRPLSSGFVLGQSWPKSQMEHDRQMALKAEAEKVAAKKKLLEVQRGALHAQMQERENLKREVRERATT